MSCLHQLSHAFDLQVIYSQPSHSMQKLVTRSTPFQTKFLGRQWLNFQIDLQPTFDSESVLTSLTSVKAKMGLRVVIPQSNIQTVVDPQPGVLLLGNTVLQSRFT